MAPSELLVLVADDDDATRGAVVELLARRGIATAQAADGLEALALLDEAAPPCMVLLDWVMPRAGGEAFLQARQASPWLSTVPVVVLSATHAPVADPRVHAFLPKPVAPAALVTVLRETCRTACPDWLRARRGCPSAGAEPA